MFGHHLKKTVRAASPTASYVHHQKVKNHKKEKYEKKAMKKAEKMYNSAPAERSPEEKKSEIARITGERQAETAQAEERGIKKATEFTGRNVEGLNPQQRSAMQHEANRQIENQVYHQNRQMGGKRSQSGIGHKSGIAFAQREAVQKGAQEARGQSERDINRLDADQRMRNLAAQFAIQQGEVGRSDTARQEAEDMLRYEDEKKRSRHFEKQLAPNVNKYLFSRY